MWVKLTLVAMALKVIWLVVWVLWHINHCRLLMPNQFLYMETVLFQTIQFSISTQFSSVWPIDRTLSSTTTLGKSGPGSDGNEQVLRIPQSSSITGTSPSDCLVSYPEQPLWGLTPLQRSRLCILQPHPTGQPRKWAC